MTSDPDHVRDEEIETVRGEPPAEAADQEDARDAADQAGVAAPSGATDTGAMMDARDAGTIDRTDVGEGEDADADESDR